MNPLLLASATQLAQMIRAKQVSAEEVVQTYIQQAKKVNRPLNAIVNNRYEMAVLEAKEADKFLKSDPEDLPPLLGVPCTIKELIAVKDFPLTTGLVHRKHELAPEDATAVARLREAGAIPLGTTNVAFMGITFETTNKLYGRTNNPYNLDRNPGGSSGGEAAIISAAGSAFGLGTDGGGSIRIPASFCGIFGHKSSAHLVPITGHYPPIESEIGNRMIVFGAMSRYSEDLMPVLRLIAGPDGKTPSMESMVLGDENQVKIPELTYYYGTHSRMEEGERQAHAKAIALLRQSGAQVKEIDMDVFKYAYEISATYFGNILSHDELARFMGGPKDYKPTREILKGLWSGSDYPFHINLMQLLIPPNDALIRAKKKDFFQLGIDLSIQLNEILGDNSVLIFPTLPFPAIKHGTFIPNAFRGWMTAIFNVTESPSTAIPMGLNDAGLPVGIQAVARKGNDHLTIAVAKYFESQGFGWIPPKLAE